MGVNLPGKPITSKAGFTHILEDSTTVYQSKVILADEFIS